MVYVGLSWLADPVLARACSANARMLALAGLYLQLGRMLALADPYH